MKRSLKLIGMCLALAMTLSACGMDNSGQPSENEQEKVSSSLSRGFDAKATIKMGDIEAEADINRTKEGVCTVQLTSPKGLSGMTFSFDQKNVTVSYMGLSLELDNDSVLTSSMTKAVVASINMAAEPHGVSMALEGEALVIKGTTESGDFTLKLDRSNYSVLTLSIPNLDLECNFNPFSYQE